MAKKQGAGIAAKAPKPRPTHAQNKKQKQKAAKGPQYGGLNQDQSNVINQTNRADFQLGEYGAGLLPDIGDAYNQPFDYSQLPTSPWAQGQTLDQMEDEYYNRSLENFNRTNEKVFADQLAAFENEAYNKGWAPGSELYNKEKTRIEKSQADARQGAMDSAYFNAGQNAANWNNIGTQNFQNAYGFAQDQRNQPLADYTRLIGAQSGMQGQNLGYSQAFGLQNDAQAHDQWMMKNTPRGGGGGGGSPSMWQQYGFASPMEYDAYKMNQAREAQQWEWANNPQYRQPKQPSPWSSALGQIGGIGAGAFMGSLFS